MKKPILSVLFMFVLFVLGSTSAYAYEKIQVDSVDGTIWDYKDNRILFLDANHALKVKDQTAGQITTIVEGKTPIVGYLAPKGAIFLAKSDAATLLYDWRNGNLVEVGEVDPTLIVKGNYAVYNVGSTIYLRDLTTGESKVVTDKADEHGYDVGSNGMVVWSDKENHQIYSNLNGVTTQETSNSEKKCFSPITDGESIIYTRVPASEYGDVETVLQSNKLQWPEKERVLGSSSAVNLPYEDYSLNKVITASFKNNNKDQIYFLYFYDGYFLFESSFYIGPSRSFKISPNGDFLYITVSDKVYFKQWYENPESTSISPDAKVYWTDSLFFVAEGGILSKVLAGSYDHQPVHTITPALSSDPTYSGWTNISEYTLTATDDGTNLKTEWYLNSKKGEGTTVRIPGEGHYILTVRSTDSGGHFVEQNYYANLDTTPPVTTSTVTPDGDLFTVKLSAKDNLSGVKAIFYRIDKGNWVQYYFPLKLTAYEKDSLEFYSKDIAGNIEKTNPTTPADTTAPTTELLANSEVPAPWFNTNISVQLKAVDNESGSGVAKTYFRINGGTLQQYSAPFVLSDAGQYTIEYYSSDVAGNKETTKSVTLKIDKSAPVTKHEVTPISGGYSVTLTASDNLAGVKKTFYRINAGTWTAYSASITVPAGQAQNLEFYSEDHAGNKEPVGSILVGTGDTAAPTTTLQANGAAPAAWYKTDINVQLTASDGESGSGVAQAFYRVNGGEWERYLAPFTLSASGTYKVEYYSSDLAGNKETAKTVTLGIDKTSPVTGYKITPVYGNDKPYRYIKAYSVTVTAKDNLSGVKATFYRINGGAWTRYAGPFNLPASGNKNLEFYSEDNAGNKEAAANDADTTAPTTELLVNAAAPAAWYNAGISVQLKAADNNLGSGLSKSFYRINGGDWQEYSKPFTLTDAGSYQIEYYSSDLAGNIEKAKSTSLSIDKAVPTTTLLANSAAPTAWYNKDISIVLNAADHEAGSGIAKTFYRINGGGWQEYSGAFSVSDAGEYKVEYYSSDKAGNSESAKSVTLGIDKNAPVTKYTVTPVYGTDKPVKYIKGYSVTVTATDDRSGIKDTFYRVNQGEWTKYSSPFTLPAAGTLNLEFYSTDNAGNEEAITNDADLTAPTTELLANTATPAAWYRDSISVQLNATDNAPGSGVFQSFYRINGGSWQEYTGPFTLSENGQYQVEYYSSDNAGNIENAKTATLRIDKTAPVTKYTVDPVYGTDKPYRYIKGYTVTVTATDNLSGVKQTFYRINNGEWTLYSAPITLTGSGDTNLEFYSEDNAGNKEVHNDSTK